MIFGRTKLELKVGIFVFLGLVILTVFVLSIGGFKTWTMGYRVNFSYNFVNGVKVGGPVRFAGVDVGVIKRIKFFTPEGEKEEKVVLQCWIKQDIKIPLDSTAWINTLGVLGEKYIEIMPGKDYQHYLKPGESLKGEDPLPMHEVFRMVRSTVEGLNAGINNKQGTIGRLLHEDTVYKNLEAFTDDIRRHPWKLLKKTKENR
ncbi:MAG: MlaD family protein [Candidatus Omnitrophota bacterium]|jgi:phospholipid/cholesterol/gamma-HCH transport system substrate-binding protein